MTEDVHSMDTPAGDALSAVEAIDTHPETGLPIQQCPGRGDHSAHNWNVYDPTGVKLTRVNPAGARTCLGHSPFAGITYPHGEVTDAQGYPLPCTPGGASSEVNADIPASRFEPTDWEARLRQAVAATLDAKTRRRNQRTVLAQNRDWGLRQRHAAKLDRIQNNHGSQQ